MRSSTRGTVRSVSLAIICLLAGSVAAQDNATPVEVGTKPEVEIGPASEEEVERLLAAYERALDSKDGVKIAKALRGMRAFDNAEFSKPAARALKYRSSRLDRQAVERDIEELGIEDEDERKQMLADREAEVQAAGARLLANFPGTKSTSLLHRSLKTKGLVDDRPTVGAAVIDALGRLDFSKAEMDVLGEYRKYGDQEVMRACVRFFGQTKTKNKGVVRILCEELTAPGPSIAEAEISRPASYWEDRWKKWGHIRLDITWALSEITGQTFRPQGNSTPSDTDKALAWLREHGRESGIK